MYKLVQSFNSKIQSKNPKIFPKRKNKKSLWKKQKYKEKVRKNYGKG